MYRTRKKNYKKLKEMACQKHTNKGGFKSEGKAVHMLQNGSSI